MINFVKARTSILALILFVFISGQAFADPAKIVVIPLGADAKAPTCTTRVGQTVFLFGKHVGILANCLEGEIAMSGGYQYSAWDTSKDCRVIESKPYNGSSWYIEWGAPTQLECAENSATAIVNCCAW